MDDEAHDPKEPSAEETEAYGDDPPSDQTPRSEKMPPTPNAPPEVDLAGLHARDPAVIKEVIKDATPIIRATVRAFATDDDDAEDLVQECWMHILAKLDQFNGEGSFRVWAMVVSRNCCREIWAARKRQALKTVHIDDVPEPASDELDPAEALDQNELRSAVRRALAKLPDREREAAVMKWIEDRPTPDIARRLGVSVSAARRIVHRASYKLREMRELHDAWLQ